MKMKMKKVNWKQFLLERGERVGLYSCLAVMGLMLLFGLVMAFGSDSPAENERKLTEQSQRAQAKLHAPPTSEADRAAIESSKIISAELLRSGEHRKAEAAAYRTGEMFVAVVGGDTKRRAPQLLGPKEFRAAVVLAQVRRYVFDSNDNPKQIQVLRGGKNGPMQPGNPQQLGKALTPFLKQPNPGLYQQGQKAGLPPTLPQRPVALPGGEGGGEDPKDPFAGTKQQLKSQYVDLDKLEKVDLKDARLAEDILPLRIAVVAGSFPLREQVENFRRALRLTTTDQVFASRGTDHVSQFQFLGLNVLRRTVGPDGKPTSEWARLDVTSAFKPVVVWTGRRFEAEDPNLRPVMFEGLVMPRPLQFREGQYPAVETQLKGIESTLAELKAQAEKGLKTDRPKSSPFDASDFDPFRGSPEVMPEGGQPGVDPRPMVGEGVGQQPQQQWVPPEFCLLRFLDVTIVPGKTYEYQVQVRMANPNYGRDKDVISKNLAAEKEIVSDPFPVQDDEGNLIRVRVPPDNHFYVTEARPSGAGAANQVMVQSHRWLDLVAPNPNNQSATYAVADWVVTENVPVSRGEYLRRTDAKAMPRTEVPVWLSTQEAFVLATDPSLTFGDKTKVPVPFAPAGGDLLLVDFTGGQVAHTKVTGVVDDKPTTTSVKDRAPVELLYLSPDGKLLARDSETDKRDPQRQERVEHYKKRVGEAKDREKKEPPKDPKKGPNPIGG